MVSFEELKVLGEKWAKEYCEVLNNSPEYNEAASGWGIDFEGAMLVVMTASGEIDFDIRCFLDLKDGKCLGIKILDPDEDPPRETGMTLRAPLYIWRKMAFKEINPIQALMSGDLELEGDMSLVMKYSKAAMMLADLTEKTDRTLFTQFDLGD
ncbi:MAG: SCP2 sterol-binding domain-containing protein [Candidatus Helarchaeota archaeon]